MSVRKSGILIITFNLSIESLIPIVADMESKIITVETLKNEITNITLDDDVITFIKSISESRERLDECSLLAYLLKQRNNQSITEAKKFIKS